LRAFVVTIGTQGEPEGIGRDVSSQAAVSLSASLSRSLTVIDQPSASVFVFGRPTGRFVGGGSRL
jgi:hypothetical protein